MTSHPTLPGRLVDASGFGDETAAWPVVGTRDILTSGYASVRQDTITTPTDESVGRLVVQPQGAVAVVAVDDAERVLLVRQYRHPVRARLVELPAGTLDVEGEPRLQAARRELAEEADLAAAEWTPLLSLTMTPGYSTERLWIFLARRLNPVDQADRFTREHEEAGIEQFWIGLDDALRAVGEGRITDAKTVAALYAYAAAR